MFVLDFSLWVLEAFFIHVTPLIHSALFATSLGQKRASFALPASTNAMYRTGHHQPAGPVGSVVCRLAKEQPYHPLPQMSFPFWVVEKLLGIIELRIWIMIAFICNGVLELRDNDLCRLVIVIFVQWLLLFFFPGMFDDGAQIVAVVNARVYGRPCWGWRVSSRSGNFL